MKTKINLTEKLKQNHHHLSAIINRTKANEAQKADPKKPA